MKIFVVTSGSYSDYGIDAMFSTRELAEAFISSFEYNSYRNMDIEEWELDPFEPHLKAGRKAYFLRIDRDGVVTDLENSDSAFGFKSPPRMSYTHDKVWLNIYVFADNEDHAIKIAGERRSQILALNSWGINPPPL